MENKTNQPNAGANASSNANTNKTNLPSSAGLSGTTGGQDAGAGREQSNVGASASTAESSQSQGRQSQGRQSQQNQPQGSQNQNEQQNDQQGGQKSWLNQQDWMKNVNQLPQQLKDFGSKALEQVNGLTTTQKVVGGALLVSGLSWLALRGKSSKSSKTYKGYKGGYQAPVAGGSRYTPQGESKWKSGSSSVYRGSTTSLHDADDDISGF